MKTWRAVHLPLLTFTVSLILASVFFAFSLHSSQASTDSQLNSIQKPPGYPTQLHGGVELSAAELRALPPPDPARFAEREHEEEKERQESGAKRFSSHALLPFSTRMNEALFNKFSEQHYTAAAPAPTPVTSWKSLDAVGDLAADVNIAVSRTHVVVTTRTTVSIHDKAGRQLQQISSYDLFAPLNLDHLFPGFPPVKDFFDTRCLFDEYRKRFWIGALAYNVAGKDRPEQRLTKFVVAVSKTEDPLDGFYLYWWDAVVGDGTDFKGAPQNGNLKTDGGDYPCIGIDQYGFYQTNTVNALTIVNGKITGGYARYWNVTFFPADPLANGTFASGWSFGSSLRKPDNNPNFNVIQPAVHHGPSATTYLVSYHQADKLALWKLTDHLKPTMQMKSFPVAVKQINPICNQVACSDGPQKNSSTYPGTKSVMFRNLGNEPLKAVFRNNRVYTVLQDSTLVANTPVRTNSRAVVIANVSSNATSFNTELDQTFIDSNFITHSGWPSIEVNNDNNAAIVYATTSSDTFPSLKVRTRAAGETSVSEERTLKDGEDTFIFLIDHDENPSTPNVPMDPVQMHDHNSAAVDPYDDKGIWVAGSYAISLTKRNNDNFAVWVAKMYGEKHPDLIVQSVGTVKPVYKPGETLNLVTTVRNQGDGNSTASVADIYLSKDSSISILDQRIATANFAQLSSGAVTSLGSSYSLPNNIEPGIYWVGAIIGPLPGEYSTTNNIERGARPVIIRAEDANTFLPAPGAKWHESFGFTGEVPASGDFNGDGKDDICVFNKTDGSVYVALSDGAKFNGSGAAARWISGFSQGNEVPLVGDFNGDGKDDVVTLVQSTKTGTEAFEVYVALSTGTKFGPETKWHDNFSQTNDRVAIGDFNGDGKDDLLAVVGNGQVYVAPSDGTRFGIATVWFQFASQGTSPRIVGDFNGDGLDDLATFSLNIGDVNVVISSSSNFLSRPTWAGDFANGTELPLAGDFNGDGRADAIVFTRGNSHDVFVSLSDGAKLIEPREKWHDQFAVGTETPIIGDFNGDGADDIATFLLGSDGDVFVSLARRKSLGSVSAASFSATAFTPDSIAAVFGLNLATGVQVASTTPLPTTLLGTKVTVTDRNGSARLAPLFFVSPGQINYLIPTGTATGAAVIKVEDGAGFVSSGTLNIARVAPGLFTANANGQDVPAAIIVRVRNGVQTVEPVATFDQRAGRFVPVPIDLGPETDQVVLVLFGTGIRGHNGLSNITCRMNRIIQPVLFAGAQGGFVGLDQVNVLLPRTLAGAGEVALDLIVENSGSNIVKINVK
jgi:uncharacterized protein (TIGR03437 family)